MSADRRRGVTPPRSLPSHLFNEDGLSQLLPNKSLHKARKERVVKRKRQEVFTSVRISRSTYDAVQKLALKLQRTQSWIFREAIESWVTYHSAKEKIKPSRDNDE